MAEQRRITEQRHGRERSEENWNVEGNMLFAFLRRHNAVRVQRYWHPAVTAGSLESFRIT